MADILEAIIRLRAEASNFKEAANSAEQLADDALRVSESLRRSLQASKANTDALKEMIGANQQGREEFRKMQEEQDRLVASMRRGEKQLEDLSEEIEKSDDATLEMVENVRRLSEETSEYVQEQLRATQQVRENRTENESAVDSIRKHEDALNELVNRTEDYRFAMNAQVTAQEQVATAYQRAEIETRRAITAGGQYEQHIEGRAAAIKDINRELARNQILENSATQAKLEAAQASRNLRIREAELAQQTTFLGIATDDLKRSLITAVAAGGVAGLVFKGMELIGDGFRKAKDWVIEFQKASIETFAAVQEEIARTKAQVPGLVDSQEELFRTTVAFGREILRGPEQTAEALRKAQNLGRTYAEAMEDVESASKAAIVGNTDLTDTLVAALSTVNAYGEGVYTTGQILDQFAYITQNSNLETEDLVRGMAKIISPAAEAGVGIEEVAAAMITMNRQGDDFQEIGELLGLTLQQIGVQGTQLSDAFVEASGMGFREFTAAGGTLVEGLELLQKHADETNQSIGELTIGTSKFYRDSQAGRGIQELTGRHLQELADAYMGAAEAQGALNEQVENFEGTLYAKNLELEAAKESAYAVQGSITQTSATSWIDFKTGFYDIIRGLSEGLVVTNDLNNALVQTEASFNFFQVRTAIGDITRGIEDINEKETVYNDLQRKAAQLILETKDLTYEQLVAELQRIYNVKQITELSQEQLEAEQDLAQLKELNGRQAKQQAEEEAAAKREVAEAEERKAHAAELAAIAAEKELERQELIKARLLEQAQILAGYYSDSQNFIQNISDLQRELSLATEQEDIDKLTEQMREAEDAIQNHYRKAIVEAMLANYGYNESIVDLAVELGLITEEAGAMQKDFVRITSELDKLAKIEGFNALPIEAQAAAAERLADGLAKSADEAFAYFDPKNWDEGIKKGIAKAEEAFKIEPEMQMSPEEQADLDALEAQLNRIVEDAWVTDISVPTEQPITDLNIIEEEANAAAAPRDLIITVKYREEKSEEDPDYPSFATGGSFTVPQGYYRDNYLIGVSSGERVNVTPAGASVSPGGGMTIELTQQFFGGGAINTTEVANATKDGLYEALELAGLI